MTTAPAIDADLRCTHCGYNLRTLAGDARCPECGRPVADSLRAEYLPPLSQTRRRFDAAAVLTLLAASLLMAAGTFHSATPWPETALLGVGVTGPRLWLPAASRQLVGFHDPREYLATALTFAGILLHLIGALPLTLRDHADARASIVARVGLRLTLAAAPVFLVLIILQCPDRPGSPHLVKYWGRGTGLILLAILDLAQAFFLHRLLARVARRARAPGIAKHLTVIWFAFLVSYPTGMLVILVALVGLYSTIALSALAITLLTGAANPDGDA